MKSYKLKISNSKYGVYYTENEFETFEQAMKAGLGLKKFNRYDEYFSIIQVEETYSSEDIKIPEVGDSA